MRILLVCWALILSMLSSSVNCFACLVSLNSSLFDLFSVFSIILCSVYLNFYYICFLLYNYLYLIGEPSSSGEKDSTYCLGTLLMQERAEHLLGLK